MKRFIQNTGYIQTLKGSTDGEKQCDRKGLLVYEGIFDSMDGEVVITPKDIENLAKNHNGLMSKLSRLANGVIPIQKCKPIQVDHSESAHDTIGRVIGKVSIGTHLNEDGDTVKALYADKLRFLGKENVEKVKDGRWAELSIGADIEKGKLSEISVTPFPAAPSAALLAKGKNMNRKKIMKYLMDVKDMPKEDAEKMMDEADEKKMKKLMDDCDKHEAKMCADEKERKANLTAEEKESEAKMAAEEEEEKAKLAAEKEEKERLSNSEDLPENEVKDKHDGGGTVGLEGYKHDDELSNAEDLPEAKLKAMMAGKSKKVRLAMITKNHKAKTRAFKIQLRSANIHSQLARLRSCGKITPAEIKKMDIKKLSLVAPEIASAVLQTYADREPQIHAGVYGTTKAINLSKIQKEMDRASLENETRSHMSLKKSTVKKEGEINLAQTEAALRMASATVHGTEYDQICQFIDKGDTGQAKLALKQELERVKLTASYNANAEKQLAALVNGFQTLQNSYETLISEVSS